MANLSQLLPITNNLVTQTDLTTSLASKVTGAAATSSVGGDLKLYEATDNGTNYVSFKAPNTLAGNVTWVLPSVDGTNGQALVTNGSGTLSWGSASSQWTTSGSNIYYNTGAILGGNASSIGSLPLRFQSKGAAGGGSPGAGYSVISGNDEVAGHIVLASTAENSINISVDPQNLRASSSLQFSVDGSERARISAAGGFSVGTTADPGAGAIYATGNITAYYSDQRLKTVSGRIENALDKVDSLSGVYYTNNDVAKAHGYTSEDVQVGVLAQEVEAVLPQVVKAAPFDLDENGNSKSGENYKTVQYDRLVPLLIEAIKELRAEVKELKGA